MITSPLDGADPIGGDVRRSSARFLAEHGFPRTAAHCASVAAEARRLARRFGVNEDQAELAGPSSD